jgi:hypothetical protein
MWLCSEEIHEILDCYLTVCKQQSGRDTALVHRVAALLRRYLACRPARAAALLALHRDTVQSVFIDIRHHTPPPHGHTPSYGHASSYDTPLYTDTNLHTGTHFIWIQTFYGHTGSL